MASNFLLNVKAVADLTAIKSQLAELSKNTTITVNVKTNTGKGGSGKTTDINSAIQTFINQKTGASNAINYKFNPKNSPLAKISQAEAQYEKDFQKLVDEEAETIKKAEKQRDDKIKSDEEAAKKAQKIKDEKIASKKKQADKELALRKTDIQNNARFQESISRADIQKLSDSEFKKTSTTTNNKDGIKTTKTSAYIGDGQTITLTEKLDTATNKLTATYSKSIDKVRAARDTHKAANKAMEEGKKAQKGLVDTMMSNIKAAATWAIAMGVLYGSLRKLKEGMQFVYDLDNQMTNIRMVTGGTVEETNALAKSYNNLANEISSNTMDVAKNAEEWLRQGRTVSDTNSLIKTSMIFSKVGMLDSAEAANLLTSSINGYKMSASEAMSVVDKMSAIDVNAATSTQDLALALSQTASSASIAGVKMDEILSYIATVKDVTQKSAESIGNSFKTMFARIQAVKIGSLVDEDGESVSNVDKVLQSYGISLRNAQGTFRDTGEVLNELSEKWKTLNSMQKSEIGTTVAGFSKIRIARIYGNI